MIIRTNLANISQLNGVQNIRPYRSIPKREIQRLSSADVGWPCDRQVPLCEGLLCRDQQFIDACPEPIRCGQPQFDVIIEPN